MALMTRSFTSSISSPFSFAIDSMISAIFSILFLLRYLKFGGIFELEGYYTSFILLRSLMRFL
ncbi:hypothetical protein, partial [uncultured Campylobacter sp.]|uniref:hypothetical protein n=1 Tax=uncultured Campylobacter sp. TaxID=218934 RepID=UPI0028EBD948